MPDALTITLLFTGLILLLMLPNIKIVRKNEVMIIERLGRFHKLLDKPGIYILVPLLDRNIQTVNLNKKHIKKKLTLIENETKTVVEISYDMIVKDVKTFVYASLDSNETIHIYIKEALEAGMSTKEIIVEVTDYALTYGFAIENINFK